MIRCIVRSAATVLSVAATVNTLTISTALAHEMPAAGAPPDLNSGHAGYYVWNDDHELHVRMTGGATPAEYRGTLRTTGKFADLAHDGDVLHGHSAISDGGHILHFRAVPGTDLDGFKVRVEDSTRVDARLKSGGVGAPTDRIWLGSNDSHPDSSDFSLRI